MRRFGRALRPLVLLLASACGEDEVDPECTGTQCTPTNDAGTSTTDSAVVTPSDAAATDATASAEASTAASDASMTSSDAAATDGAAPSPGAGPAEGGSGCGKSGAPPSGTYNIDVDGTQRTYIVTLPTNYDVNKPYKLVFAWHGLGGTAQSIARNYYGLQSRAMNSTIFVAGQGLSTGAGGAGWPNTNGRDVNFVRKLFTQLNSQYCIDQKRVFSVGMSYGGIMSNTLGCQMGDVFRAIAPIAGMGPRSFGTPQCKGQVAAWLAHGNQDTVVTFASGQGSRDYWVQANHCQTQTQPTEPSPCVAYQGCDAGFPVHWCEFAGGHIVPQFASAAIWSFFSQF